MRCSVPFRPRTAATVDNGGRSRSAAPASPPLPRRCLPVCPPALGILSTPQRAASLRRKRLAGLTVRSSPPEASGGDFSRPAAPKQQKTWLEEFPGACRPWPALASLSLGLALRFALPCPPQLSPQAWNLTAIFLTTAVGLVLKPLPLSAWAFLCLTVAVATHTLTIAAAFSAFTLEAIWLVVISFFFAKGVESSGLGERIANLFVRACGTSSLGLAYGLVGAGSLPHDPSARRLGSFLTMTQLQCSCASSAMFLTGAAQNFLCVKLAAEMGVPIPDTFITWLKGAIVPASLSLLATPLILYKFFGPQLRHTPEAPVTAARRLKEMGSLSRPETAMLIILFFMLGLWIFGPRIGVSAGVAAMMGLSALMVTGVLPWEECLNNKGAWDTLMWFAILTGMAGQLNVMGVTAHFSSAVGDALTALNLGWQPVWAILCCTYFAMHYVFASQTGHVAALYSGFLAMLLSAGVPSMLAALSLCWLSSLYSGVSHFASGQGAVYAGSGYISIPEIFKWGAIIGAVNVIGIWGIIGSFWWRFIGLV